MSKKEHKGQKGASMRGLSVQHPYYQEECCFDLQQVLDAPCSNVGDVFYKRCLSCYNFVVNDREKAHCYFWSEDQGNRGVNEITSNLIWFAETKDVEGITNIVAYCDGCGGQCHTFSSQQR